ncbi:ATP-grasp domain-containing protein [Candidatus Korobacter versatilis]|uniref:ATP-grasp domain-containing protein n=1 Tax=Candidatus Korobacter versatilis TaxID=658062 RepID=UPI0005A49657|nr:ATP-grasp domain-containing protein [Candidatus Koribacter versatilis]
MKQPAVLITSAGRRTSLLGSFVKAAQGRGWRVLAGDRDPLAPTLYLADEGLKLPSLSEHDYIPCLLELVRERSIRMIVPTIDTELGLLARHADDFRKEGCVAVISSGRLIEIAGDKWLTMQEYAARAVRTPKSWLPDALPSHGLPESLFVKPRDGSASQHAYRVQSSELARKLPEVPNAIVQEELRGNEITIDALIDLNGQPLHYVPRVRIRTLGGESIQGVTIAGDEIRDWIIHCLNVTAELGGVGPITMQAFLTPDGPVLSEVNPRFGGGFPLTLAAGGAYPDWLIAMVEGEKIDPRFGEYRRGLYMTRYYVEFFTDKPLWEAMQ